MPELEGLDVFLQALREPEHAKAVQRVAALDDRLEQAEYVQLGLPPGDSVESYKLMVDHVADLLGAGAWADDRALRKSCAQEAKAANPGERRRAFQLCLGRRKAEAVYLNAAALRSTAHTGWIGEAAARERILVALAQESKLPPGLAQEFAQKIEEIRRRLTFSPGDWTTLPVPEPPSRFRSGTLAGGPAGRGVARILVEGAAFPSIERGLPDSSLHGVDLGKGAELARYAEGHATGFIDSCYLFVKQALMGTGLTKDLYQDPEVPIAEGENHSAYMFNEFIKQHPALLNRKLRLVPSPRWPLAIGSIVVWAPGSGYNPVHGHIEIVTRIKPPQACSDGCGAFRRDTMEGLAARAAAAAERVQELGRQIAQLQASGISDSRRKRQLAQLRGRQAAAVKASEPLVKVYVIER